MNSIRNTTTRGAANAAPRRYFSLILVLIVLFSFACPALATDAKIDISDDFWAGSSVGTCSSYPKVFDTKDQYEKFRKTYPVYFFQSNSDTLERTTNGGCYYAYDSALTRWNASVAINRNESDVIYTTAVSNYNAVKSNIILDDTIALSETADHLLFFVADSRLTNVAYLLVEWGEAEKPLTDEQKKPLTDVLATVTGENEAKWKQSGDCYNGKTYNPSGFWADFTAKPNGERAKAERALQEAKSDADITAAVANLNAAISNLIPASQLNATELYETLQTRDYDDEYLEKFTAPSVRKFRAARSAAQNYLDSLFDEQTRKATAENVSANQDKANNYAKELRNCQLVSKDAVEESKVNLRSIQALDKKYAALKENSGKYTDASWKKLTDARDAAVNYAAVHPISENTGVDEPKQYASLTRAFLKAYYDL